MLIGIDLGTTNSLCAVFRDSQPQLIPNRHGSFLTPSVVGFLESGELLVGEPARELQVTRPQRCASRFKRMMGTSDSVQLHRNHLNAEDLSSFVLKSLKQDAEDFLDEEVTEAVITVPAYFNELQRRATKLAGELAGLQVRRIINEPTAAALTYGFHDRNAEKHLLVIDLGGGTFDVTLMEVFDGTLEIIASDGQSTLGGEDFTDRLVASVLEQKKTLLETAEIQQPLLVSRLRQECEKAKRKLGEQPEYSIRIPDQKGNFAAGATESVTVTAADFLKMCEPLLQRIRGPIAKVLRDAQLSKEQLDDIILVGGATRMPILQDCVRELFGREPLCQHDPDQVVALGAAVQAALITQDAAVDDLVMTDVCPFTLGVSVMKDFGGQQVSGFFMPIIHRNTTLPVSKEDHVSTIYPNQREVNILVYQGEHRKVDDNVFLGKLVVENIPPGPSGTPLTIRFTYDINGLLEVEAFVTDGGQRFKTVLTNHAQNLAGSELQQAIKRLEAIKFYPRDDVREKRLLLFAERILGEVSPFQRTEFERVLDQFEVAMNSGDRNFFEQMRQILLQTLEQLGFPYPEVNGEAEDPDK